MSADQQTHHQTCSSPAKWAGRAQSSRKQSAWEATRPADRSPADHEQAWPHADQLRTELNRVREGLLAYADQLGDIAGVAPLPPQPASTRSQP